MLISNSNKNIMYQLSEIASQYIEHIFLSKNHQKKEKSRWRLSIVCGQIKLSWLVLLVLPIRIHPIRSLLLLFDRFSFKLY